MNEAFKVEHVLSVGKLLIEIIAALIIVSGVIHAFVYTIRVLWKKEGFDFTFIRVEFSKFLILALEFQLAADILGTSVAPSWDQLGKLGAIAVIRTFLNYFLNMEIQEIGGEGVKNGRGSDEKQEAQIIQ